MSSETQLLIRRLRNANGIVSLRASVISASTCPSNIELTVSGHTDSVSIPAYISSAFKSMYGAHDYDIELSAWGHSPFEIDETLFVTATLKYPDRSTVLNQVVGDVSDFADGTAWSKSLRLLLKVQKAWGLLKAGEMRFLWEAVKSSALQFASSARWISINRWITAPDTVKDMKGYELFIDHGFGGGTNSYSRRYCEGRRSADGAWPLTLVFDPWRLEFRVTCRRTLYDKVLWFKEYRVLCAWIGKQEFRTITVNSIFGFPAAGDLLGCIRDYKKRRPATQVRIMTHDYYSVCPSPHLMNFEGRFCGIPALDVCGKCFDKHPLIKSSPGQSASVREWRSLWRTTYETADVIRVFSASSQKLLSSAFPEIPRDKYELTPHQTPGLTPVPVPRNGSLHVGILGHLNDHKGSRQVHELMGYMESYLPDAAVSVFGSIYPPCEYRCATVHRHYDVKKLTQLVHDAGINIFFFPSICPETYSFVADEMMQLGLPVVCFDIGAPAERVQNYTWGSVIPLGSGQDSLVAIEKLFYRRYGFQRDGKKAAS